ncbi:hypothetical protein [Streptomyces sp. NPDC002550]
MTVGTWVGGELASWSVYQSLLLAGAGSAVLMGAFWAVVPYGWWALPLLFLISAAGAVFVTNLQFRLMKAAGDAVTLGAAMIQSALNIANALGAWPGGVVISAGLGHRAPALIGAALPVAGVALLWWSPRVDRRTLLRGRSVRGRPPWSAGLCCPPDASARLMPPRSKAPWRHW